MIERHGQYSPSAASSLHNDHLYLGSENTIRLVHSYILTHECVFDMKYYPFDTQTCRLLFTTKVRIALNGSVQRGNIFVPQLQGVSGMFIELKKGYVRYMGPKELTQYYVKSFAIDDNYKNSLMGPAHKAVVVEIVLGRRVLNQLLTTFLPSGCLCVVAFSTNFFKVSTYVHSVTMSS